MTLLSVMTENAGRLIQSDSLLFRSDYQALYKRTSTSSLESEIQSKEKEIEKPVSMSPAEVNYNL